MRRLRHDYESAALPTELRWLSVGWIFTEATGFVKGVILAIVIGISETNTFFIR